MIQPCCVQQPGMQQTGMQLMQDMPTSCSCSSAGAMTYGVSGPLHPSTACCAGYVGYSKPHIQRYVHTQERNMLYTKQKASICGFLRLQLSQRSLNCRCLCCPACMGCICIHPMCPPADELCDPQPLVVGVLLLVVTMAAIHAFHSL